MYLKLLSLASLMRISPVGNAKRSHDAFHTETWLELPHKLRHGPLLQGRRPCKWDVLKHLSVSWLFLISISETRDPNNRSVWTVMNLWGMWSSRSSRIYVVLSHSFHHMQMVCLSSKMNRNSKLCHHFLLSAFFQETTKVEWMKEWMNKWMDTKAVFKVQEGQRSTIHNL